MGLQQPVGIFMLAYELSCSLNLIHSVEVEWSAWEENSLIEELDLGLRTSFTPAESQHVSAKTCRLRCSARDFALLARFPDDIQNSSINFQSRTKYVNILAPFSLQQRSICLSKFGVYALRLCY